MSQEGGQSEADRLRRRHFRAGVIAGAELVRGAVDKAIFELITKIKCRGIEIEPPGFRESVDLDLDEAKRIVEEVFGDQAAASVVRVKAVNDDWLMCDLAGERRSWPTLAAMLDDPLFESLKNKPHGGAGGRRSDFPPAGRRATSSRKPGDA